MCRPSLLLPVEEGAERSLSAEVEVDLDGLVILASLAARTQPWGRRSAKAESRSRGYLRDHFDPYRTWRMIIRVTGVCTCNSGQVSELLTSTSVAPLL